MMFIPDSNAVLNNVELTWQIPPPIPGTNFPSIITGASS